MKSLLVIIVIASTIYGLLALSLYLRQRKYLYSPTPVSPVILEHSLEVQSGGERLRVGVVNPGMATAIIYFGGNAEDVYQRASQHQRLLSEHTVYLVNYRGYGGSTGQPTESGLYADAAAVYDFIAPQHQQIAVIGRSLGSGVASWLAVNRTLSRLVLVTPYDSIERVASRLYPLFPVTLLLHDKFDSASRAPLITIPTLILIAAEDEVIHPSHSDTLISQFPDGVVTRVLVHGANHGDPEDSKEFENATGNFLNHGKI